MFAGPKKNQPVGTHYHKGCFLGLPDLGFRIFPDKAGSAFSWQIFERTAFSQIRKPYQEIYFILFILIVYINILKTQHLEQVEFIPGP